MNTQEQIEREAILGVLPTLPGERKYGFIDALLILSGYCIATWSYTHGAYLATLVGFKQLLIGAFFGAILMLAIYQLPIIISVRYGIDIWIWLRAALGKRGALLISLIIIGVNYPWYAVSADMFASSMNSLGEIISLPHVPHALLAVVCVIFGTFLAYRGMGAITLTTRLLVPLLLVVGVIALIAVFTSVSPEVIWNYQPQLTSMGRGQAYILSIEANFAFVITLIGGMAEIPRLTKRESSALYSGILGQGLAGSLFVVLGAVMAIAMEHKTGEMLSEPTLILSTLTVPAMGFCSLLLVAFANIGTQAVGAYLYGVMLKSSFKKISYHMIISILALYVCLLCIWGKINQYFGSFLTIGACVYAPVAAVLFADFFFVRKQRFSMASAYELKGHSAYTYHRGFNPVGLFCILFGFIISLTIYDPIKSVVHIPVLFVFTPTMFSFASTVLLYTFLCAIKPIRKYMLQDRGDLT